jgi:predicted secreted protein
MSATAGYTSKVSFNTSGSPFAGGDECDGINKSSMKLNGMQLDVTQFFGQLGWKQSVAGLKGGSFSVDGYVDRSNAPQELIRTKFLTPGTLWFQMLSIPANSTGTKGWQASVLVQDYSESTDVQGLVTFSATLNITGAAAVDS